MHISARNNFFLVEHSRCYLWGIYLWQLLSSSQQPSDVGIWATSPKLYNLVLNEGLVDCNDSPGLQNFSKTFQIWPPGNKSRERHGWKWKKNLPWLGWKVMYSFYTELNTKKDKSWSQHYERNKLKLRRNEVAQEDWMLPYLFSILINSQLS